MQQRLYRTRPEREKLCVKDTFFVLKTAELSRLSLHFIHTTRQEEPVEPVCFCSTHKEPVFIEHQNMSPYLVSFWVYRGSPPLLSEKRYVALHYGIFAQINFQSEKPHLTKTDENKNILYVQLPLLSRRASLWYHNIHPCFSCFSATWMTWRESVNQATSQLSRMCCAHAWRPPASWKLTSPSRTCISSQCVYHLSSL